MSLNTILYIVLGVSFLLFLLTVIVWKVLERRQPKTPISRSYYQEMMQPDGGSRWRMRIYNFYQKSYVYFSRTPILSGYIWRIRKRLNSIHSYDEYSMRKETMKITLWTLGSLTISFVVLAYINPEPSFLFMVLIAMFVMHGMLVDTFINRVEDRLLKRLAHLMTDVRHQYHQHGMVEEAIYEASQNRHFEASSHGEKIYDVLTANDPEAELENYYESAPNRFLKGFAGISYMTKEYGDKMLQNGSMYLSSLSRLTNEINLEVLRREKINYLMRGLTMIAVAPILFTTPVEKWARNNFPSMDEFYSGELGFVTKMVVFAVILISYILLRKIQENDEGKYAAKASRIRWEQKLYEHEKLGFVRFIVDRFIPGEHTKHYFRLSVMLKDTNSPLTLEWLYLQRILLCIVSFAIAVSTFFYMHHITTHSVLYEPTRNVLMFGKLSPEEEQKALEITDSDRAIIEKFQRENLPRTKEQLLTEVRAQAGDQRLTKEMEEASLLRIANKMEKLEGQYFKWWELLIAVGVGLIGYYAPTWVLFFQMRMRQMDMQNEVDQYHTIIAMLSEYERISVENILEWMERFSAVFRRQLQECLLNYEAGAWGALEQLKDEVPFLPFTRTIERLQVAVEKIPIRQAFDDLEAERQFYQEQRKQHYEKVINEKSSWGKMIGFLPMYALVFLYLVIPLIWMSMTQMSTYFTQIQNL